MLDSNTYAVMDILESMMNIIVGNNDTLQMELLQESIDDVVGKYGSSHFSTDLQRSMRNTFDPTLKFGE